jgi:hypothetical protein
MFTNFRATTVWRTFVWLSLPSLALVLLAFGPAAAQQKRQVPEVQANTDQSMTLAEMVALMEKEVAIKRASLKVADAQKNIAEAKLKILKSKVVAAQASEKHAKLKLERMKKLFQDGSIDQRLIDEAQAAYQAAAALRQEREETISLGEAEVALEAARREVALAELDKTELRLKQLRDRLKSKK